MPSNDQFDDFDFSFDDVEQFLRRDQQEVYDDDADEDIGTVMIYVGDMAHEVHITDGRVDVEAETDRLIERIKAEGKTFDGQIDPSPEVREVFVRNMQIVANTVDDFMRGNKKGMSSAVKAIDDVVRKVNEETPDVRVLALVVDSNLPKTPLDMLKLMYELAKDEGPAISSEKRYALAGNADTFDMRERAAYLAFSMPEAFAYAIAQMAYLIDPKLIQGMAREEDDERLQDMIKVMDLVFTKGGKHDMRNMALINIISLVVISMVKYGSAEDITEEYIREAGMDKVVEYFFGSKGLWK